MFFSRRLRFLFFTMLMAGLSLPFAMKNVSAFTGNGAGTSGSPYQITTCLQLIEVNNALDKYYLLMNDLDCTSNGNNIMIAPVNPFAGNFNGGGHTVTVAINQTNQGFQGLFKKLGAGTITDIRIAGSVLGAQNVGGLVGEMGDPAGVIARVANTARVSAIDGTVGGIVGSVWMGTSISDCYNTGEVFSYAGTAVGGIAGITTYIPAGISRCYSRGQVTGNDITGGIIGYMQGNSTLHNSFSSGKVIAPGVMVGGIVGYYAFSGTGAGILENDFWDVSRSGKTECVGANHDVVSAGICERNNATWNETNVFKGNSANGPLGQWDFTNVWETNANQYPSLRSLANDSQSVNDIQGVPGAPPTPTMGTRTSTSITLDWLPPSFDGYYTISNYTVQKSLHGANTWTSVGSTGTGLEIVASGLTANTSYDFRVIATNSQGDSAPSPIFTQSTFEYQVPSTPAKGSTTPWQSSIYFSWGSTDNGTPITSNVIQYRKVGDVSWLTATIHPDYVTGHLSDTVITGLLPQTAYEVQVADVNFAGTSGFVNSGSITTDNPIMYADKWVAGTSVTVSWTAAGATNQTLKYGTTHELGQQIVATDIGYNTTQTLSSLLPNTQYFYKIQVTYGSQTYLSEEYTFTTENLKYRASDVLGQLDGTPDFEEDNSHLDEFGFSNQSSVALDTVNHRLFVADGGGDGDYNHRIMVFNLNEDNTPIDHEADFVLGQQDFESADSATTATGMDKPRNVTYDNVHNRLFVSDGGNRRVLVYAFSEDNPLEIGMAASYVLGQADFTHRVNSTSQTKLNGPMGMSYDAEHDRLYVADMRDYRVVVFDVREAGSEASTLCGTETTGIANGMEASCVIGQKNFTNTNTDLTSNSFYSGPRDVAYDTNNELLYVADSEISRVMVFDVSDAAAEDRTLCGVTTPGLVLPTGDYGLEASCVLGQEDLESSDDGTAQNLFYTPRGLWYDASGDQLFVADLNNSRVLIFNNMAEISNQMNASAVIGQSHFEADDSYTNQYGLDTPNGLVYDSVNRRLWVSDAYNNRVMAFDFVKITTATLANGVKDTNYSANIATTDSQGEVTYSVVSGTLPAGVTLSTSGNLSGKPTVEGTFTFTAQAVDVVGDIGAFTASKTLTLTIGPKTVVTVVKDIVETFFPTVEEEETPAPDEEKVLLNEFSEYLLGAGKTFDLKQKQTVYFLAEGADGQEEHSATVTEIGSDYVIVTVASNPTALRLAIGESKLHDVTGDGKMDVSIKLESITNKVAKLVFSQVIAATPTPTATRTSPSTVADPLPTPESSNYGWILIVIFIAVCGMWLIIPKKQKR